jgi:hypothetical protein
MQYRKLAAGKYLGKYLETAWPTTSSTAIDNMDKFVCYY